MTFLHRQLRLYGTMLYRIVQSSVLRRQLRNFSKYVITGEYNRRINVDKNKSSLFHFKLILNMIFQCFYDNLCLLHRLFYWNIFRLIETGVLYEAETICIVFINFSKRLIFA